MALSLCSWGASSLALIKIETLQDMLQMSKVKRQVFQMLIKQERREVDVCGLLLGCTYHIFVISAEWVDGQVDGRVSSSVRLSLISSLYSRGDISKILFLFLSGTRPLLSRMSTVVFLVVTSRDGLNC